MSALTDAWENKFIDFVLRAQAWTISASLTVPLYSSAPGETGGGTKLTYTGYADLTITRSLANWAGTQSAGSTTASSGTGGQSSNNIALTYGAPTAGGPQTAVASALCDGAEVGIPFALTTSRTLNNGDAAPSFAIGAIVVTVA